MQSGGPLRNFVINNANYLKFRELSLSWDAPDKYAKRVGARNVGLTVAGRNLHFWSPYTGLDPESYFV